MGHTTREVVNLETTTVLYKELFEVRTRDDVRLIVTRKRPVDYLVSEGFDVYNVELRGMA